MTSNQYQPMSRAEARRFGADAIQGYRSRRASRGVVALEVLAVVITAGVLVYVATDLSGPTVIGLAIIAFILGNALFALPVVGVLASVLVSAWWGMLAFSLADGFGNFFLGVVAAAVVGLFSLGLHLGVRD
ncbi:hypothetical protein GCM10028787_31070 [Brachybacterium horti]